MEACGNQARDDLAIADIRRREGWVTTWSAHCSILRSIAPYLQNYYARGLGVYPPRINSSICVPPRARGAIHGPLLIQEVACLNFAPHGMSPRRSLMGTGKAMPGDAHQYSPKWPYSTSVSVADPEEITTKMVSTFSSKLLPNKKVIKIWRQGRLRTHPAAGRSSKWTISARHLLAEVSGERGSFSHDPCQMSGLCGTNDQCDRLPAFAPSPASGLPQQLAP